MVQQYGFYFDADRCSACKACMAACKDVNDSSLGTKYRRVFDVEGGGWSEVDGMMVPQNLYVYSLSLSCNHCTDAACVASCPQGAMTKREDGIVFVDQEVCIGCGTCATVCPYDAPKINEETKTMGKCDLCRSLIDAGENPACVDACLMRCLDFGDIEELRKEYGTNADVSVLPSSSETNPSITINPSRWSTAPETEAIINPLEEIN